MRLRGEEVEEECDDGIVEGGEESERVASCSETTGGRDGSGAASLLLLYALASCALRLSGQSDPRQLQYTVDVFPFLTILLRHG